MDMGNPDNRTIHETKGWTPNLVSKYVLMANWVYKNGNFPKEIP